jgi:hypothetical protein
LGPVISFLRAETVGDFQKKQGLRFPKTRNNDLRRHFLFTKNFARITYFSSVIVKVVVRGP